MSNEQEQLKRTAAFEALKLVRDDMVLGLGTGSTVKYLLDGLSDLIKNGYKITGVPTSKDTARRARELGIHVVEDYSGLIDLDIDGADEIDKAGNLIKGGGGALLREKVVAANSNKICIIADDTKYKPEGLGKFGVPVEIFPFMHQNTLQNVEKLGGKCTLRKEGNFVTDNGNYILDCDFGIIGNPPELESKLKKIPGVAEVGIFTGLCNIIILGTKNGPSTINIK